MISDITIDESSQMEFQEIVHTLRTQVHEGCMQGESNPDLYLPANALQMYEMCRATSCVGLCSNQNRVSSIGLYAVFRHGLMPPNQPIGHLL